VDETFCRSSLSHSVHLPFSWGLLHKTLSIPVLFVGQSLVFGVIKKGQPGAYHRMKTRGYSIVRSGCPSFLAIDESRRTTVLGSIFCNTQNHYIGTDMVRQLKISNGIILLNKHACCRHGAHGERVIIVLIV